MKVFGWFVQIMVVIAVAIVVFLACQWIVQSLHQADLVEGGELVIIIDAPLPDLKGMGLNEARAEAERYTAGRIKTRYEQSRQSPGTVIGQNPAPGHKIPSLSESIILVVAVKPKIA